MNTPATTPNPPPPARVLLKEFQEKFAVFRECKPLAIGIDKQILTRMPEIDRKVLRTALGIHANSLRYLKVMEKATVRFDLDGNPADPVTDVHRTHATEILRERFKKVAEQKKAEKAAAEAARQSAEKLSQLAAKFSRR